MQSSTDGTLARNEGLGRIHRRHSANPLLSISLNWFIRIQTNRFSGTSTRIDAAPLTCVCALAFALFPEVEVTTPLHWEYDENDAGKGWWHASTAKWSYCVVVPMSMVRLLPLIRAPVVRSAVLIIDVLQEYFTTCLRVWQGLRRDVAR
jgi:hypothetical protein